MIQRYRLYKNRLLTILFIVLVSMGAFALTLSPIWRISSAENENNDESVQNQVEFNQLDPYVCIIPDDGGMLPCHANLLADSIPIQRSAVNSLTNVLCEDGMADSYPCDNIDLVSFLPLSNFGGIRASDLWGWTDPETGQEIVIMTQRDRTSFIDITDPANPIILGHLPSPNTAINSAWRDVKTYGDYAYIVGDLALNFGMQIFDLKRLRPITQTTVFTADGRYTEINSTHNVIINEDTGLGVVSGTSAGAERCNGGLHLIDLKTDPLNPSFLGCVSEDGYVHDAQCVIYHGPDDTFKDQEICFNFNTDSIAVVDVTDRSNPIQLSRTVYTNSAYTHQGWVTADHTFMLVDDESDETNYGINTTTLIYDISKLNNPVLIGVHTAETAAIDHNQYVRDGYSFQANYRAGLRILDTANIGSGMLEEVGYFDIYPADDDAKFNAAWSAYPYFESGIVAMSGVEQGLFILQPTNLKKYRANIQSTNVISLLIATEVEEHIAIQTLGASDRYSISISSEQVVVSPSFLVIDGSPETVTSFPITLTNSTQFTTDGLITITLQSHEDPNLEETKTILVKNLAQPHFAAEFSRVGPPQVEADHLTETFKIINRSVISDRYMVEIESTTWAFESSVDTSPLIPVNDQLEISMSTELDTNQTGFYTVTLTSVNDISVTQRYFLSYTVQSIGSLEPITIVSGFPEQSVTYTLRITNASEVSDQFVIELLTHEKKGVVPVATTSTLLAGASEQIEVVTALSLAEQQLVLRSTRYGHQLDVVRLQPTVWRQFLSFSAR